jgi:hypothetical protein
MFCGAASQALRASAKCFPNTSRYTRGARGDTIPIIEVSEPKEIITAGNRQFAIVPMTTRVKIPEGTVHLKGFLIAISSNSGNSWTFIDGTYLTKERLAQLLPDFPVQLSLLPSEQAVFEPKEP